MRTWLFLPSTAVGMNAVADHAEFVFKVSGSGLEGIASMVRGRFAKKLEVLRKSLRPVVHWLTPKGRVSWGDDFRGRGGIAPAGWPRRPDPVGVVRNFFKRLIRESP